MTKARFTRAEVITVGVLALGAVGFGVYKINEQLYIQSLPQLMEEATQVVDSGQAMNLTYKEVGSTEHNSIPWSGVVEITLQRMELYGSFDEAQASEDEIDSSNGLLREDAPYLVIELGISNVDAVETGFSWDTNADLAGQGVRLLSSGFLVCFGSINDSKAPVTVVIDGQDCSAYEAYFDLPQGESVTALVGYSLSDGYDERLDSAWFTYVSPYDKIDLTTASACEG